MKRIDILKIKKAMKKDFANLYDKKFSPYYQWIRIERAVEINKMNIDNIVEEIFKIIGDNQ